MPEHFSKNAIETTAYCKKVPGNDAARVDAPKLGPCLVCLRKLEVAHEVERIRRGLATEEKAEHERQNPKLFD